MDFFFLYFGSNVGIISWVSCPKSSEFIDVMGINLVLPWQSARKFTKLGKIWLSCKSNSGWSLQKKWSCQTFRTRMDFMYMKIPFRIIEQLLVYYTSSISNALDPADQSLSEKWTYLTLPNYCLEETASSKKKINPCLWVTWSQRTHPLVDVTM